MENCKNCQRLEAKIEAIKTELRKTLDSLREAYLEEEATYDEWRREDARFVK